MTTTLTRQELSERVYNTLGLSRTDSSQLVDAVFDEMTDTMVSGDNVKIIGFGTFTLRDKNGRVGRNPKTGIEVPITPRRVVTFKASAILKDQLENVSAPVREPVNA